MDRNNNHPSMFVDRSNGQLDRHQLAALPVNNYLKDGGQIERDFSKLANRTGSGSAQIVAITEALLTTSGLEENY